MSKILSPNEAAIKVPDGASVMIGGFMGVGGPDALIEALVEKKVSDLTLIANDTAIPHSGIGLLIDNRQIKKVIASHVGLNPETGRQMNAGETEVKLVPQGTLAEAIRAGGAGLGGFLTPTGIGTVVEEGKEKITVDGKEYLLEKPLRADIALIKAYKSDTFGNLVFRRAAQNFNPLMATACDLVIVEAEEIVEVGQLDPDEVMLPSIFVDFIVKGGKDSDE